MVPAFFCDLLLVQQVSSNNPATRVSGLFVCLHNFFGPQCRKESGIFKSSHVAGWNQHMFGLHLLTKLYPAIKEDEVLCYITELCFSSLLNNQITWALQSSFVSLRCLG